MNVVMPQIGGTLSEGTIAAWRVRVGDHVELNDLILDVESDKATTEIPAPAAGTIAEILVAEGQTVGEGTVLAVIHPDTADSVNISTHEDFSGVTSHVAENNAPIVTASPDAAPLSPAVRRLLAEHGLDPSQIPGTGNNGRIKRSDVLEYLQKTEHEPAPTAAVDEEGQGASSPTIPINDLRLGTEEQKATSGVSGPHGLQAVEIDFTSVARIRAKHGESWRGKTGYSLTYLPFIARAVCVAMGEFPSVNASLEDGSLRVHPQVNLAIAVDPGRDGIVAPVIKGAEVFSVARFADRIHGLTVKARQGTLAEADLNGGTFTISNSGTFGILFTTTPIVQPQVAALSVGTISKRPVVVNSPEGDSLSIRHIGILTLSFDLRAVDWAYSAAFLRRIKSIIEESDWLGKLI